MPYRGTTHFSHSFQKVGASAAEYLRGLAETFLGSSVGDKTPMVEDEVNNEKHEKQQGKEIQSGPGVVINGGMGCFGFAIPSLKLTNFRP